MDNFINPNCPEVVLIINNNNVTNLYSAILCMHISMRLCYTSWLVEPDRNLICDELFYIFCAIVNISFDIGLDHDTCGGLVSSLG